ncbi:MAG: hypothetical protein WDW36_006063 [Sanguina aurantia]
MWGNTCCKLRSELEPVCKPLLRWLGQGARGIKTGGNAGGKKRVEEVIDERLLPKVAIIGRPNVGKSALFNKLVRQRAALVYDTPDSHVTRDYKEGLGRLGDLVFKVLDTSGLEPQRPQHTIQYRATGITARVLQQTHMALLVIDAKAGLVAHDEELARWLRQHYPVDNVILVANKAENQRSREGMSQTVNDCYRLGYGEPVAISCTTGEGMSDLFVALQPRVDAIKAQLVQADAPSSSSSNHSISSPTHDAAAGPPSLSTHSSSSGGRSSGGSGSGGGGSKPGSSQAALLRFTDGEMLSKATASAAHPAEEAGSPDDDNYGAALSDVWSEDSVVPEEGEEEGEEQDGDMMEEGAKGPLKLAIMGVPNVGKSTLMNRLLSVERSLTGPEPGLTRDAVRANWEYRGMAVELVDTAGWIGVTRTTKFDEVGGGVADLTRKDGTKALNAVNVVLLVLDCEQALRTQRVLTHREVALAGAALEEGKALVIAANKMDILKPEERRLFVTTLKEKLQERFLVAGELPVVEISALSGAGMEKLMPQIMESYNTWNKRVSTGRLNRFVRKLAVRLTGTGTDNILNRLKYMTQIKARPPSFSAFLTGSELASQSFTRFLANQIRDVLGFQGVPVRIWFRYKEKRKERQQRMLKDKATARRPEKLAERASEQAARLQVRVGSEASMGKAGLVSPGSDSDVGVQQGSAHLRPSINFVAAAGSSSSSSASDSSSRLPGTAASRKRSAGIDDDGGGSGEGGRAGGRQGSDANHGKKAHKRRDGSAATDQQGSGADSDEEKNQALSPSEALKAARKLRRPSARPSTAPGNSLDERHSAQYQQAAEAVFQAQSSAQFPDASGAGSGGSSSNSNSSQTPRQYYADTSPSVSGYQPAQHGSLARTAGEGSQESALSTSQPPHAGAVAEQGKSFQQSSTQSASHASKGPPRKTAVELRAMALFSRKPSAPLSPATPTKNRKEGGKGEGTGVYMMRHTARRRERDAASRARGGS